MRIETETKICGFTVTRVRRVSELNGTLIEMTHDKTGAQLCWMDNGEQNKLFSVAFTTLPEDSTGVFHIIEHSVFCGSDKYPVKEPFVELMKSSMNTFLNAMTYPDKTVYPVSSRNEKDFLNLTSVYLDAVFAPALLHDPNIFYQEGCHTELNDGVPSYKGVVFNEMKGAMSGIDDRIEQGMNRLLFPDNCYRFNSGGEPSSIPDLTYERFAKTYRCFYHPSNARFFLDGDIPIEATLKMIDTYLTKYERSNEKWTITLQTPVCGEGTAYYEIAEEDDERHRAVLALGKIIGTYQERTRMLAVQVLCDYLADSNESPLKRAVLSSGLAEDFEMAVTDGIAQLYLMLIVRNMADEDSAEIRRVISDAAEELLRDGLDGDALEASINRLAFRFHQTPEPQGLYRAAAALNSWLYGGDPLTYLVCDEAFNALRRMAKDGGFEALLREMLIDDDGVAVLHMLPSAALGEEERSAEEERLHNELSSLSKDAINRLVRMNQALADWQRTPDQPEQLAALPVLPLEEVSDTPEHTPTEVKNEGGVTVLYHPLPTHGIIHLSLYFPLTDFTLSELTKLSLLHTLFGELPTARRSAAELQQAIKTNIGRLSFGVEVFGRDDEANKCTPCLTVHCSILEEKLSEAQALICEMLTQTDWDQPERIHEIIVQTDAEERQMSVNEGHVLGMAAVWAHDTAQGAVAEAIGGYTFLHYLHRFAKDFDGMKDDFLSLVCRAMKTAVCKAGLTVSVTASKEAELSVLLSQLPVGKTPPANAAYTTELPKRMGIRIPSPVGFAVKGYHLLRCGMKNDGSLRVAANILSLNYLWNTVRVQGGAYGTDMLIGRDGGILCYSFRDPSVGRTLQIYDAASRYLREFCDSGESVDKYIISAVAATEPLQTPQQRGLAADRFWFAGVTESDRKRTRREMLNTDRRMLRGWCAALERMAEEGAVCVVGNDAALRECGELTVFDL